MILSNDSAASVQSSASYAFQSRQIAHCWGMRGSASRRVPLANLRVPKADGAQGCNGDSVDFAAFYDGEAMTESRPSLPPQAACSDSNDNPPDVVVLRGPPSPARFEALHKLVGAYAVGRGGATSAAPYRAGFVIRPGKGKSLVSEVVRRQGRFGSHQSFKVVGIDAIDQRGASPFDAAWDVRTLVERGMLVVCTVDWLGEAAFRMKNALRTLDLKVAEETMSSEALRAAGARVTSGGCEERRHPSAKVVKFPHCGVTALRRYVAKNQNIAGVIVRANEAAKVRDNAHRRSDGYAVEPVEVIHRPPYRPYATLSVSDAVSECEISELDIDEFGTEAGQRASCAAAYRNAFAVSRLLAERNLR
jgi:hypothetical protein